MESSLGPRHTLKEKPNYFVFHKSMQIFRSIPHEVVFNLNLQLVMTLTIPEIIV